MDTINSGQGKTVILDVVRAIQDNAAYLSELDGAVGDGDHGINMSKGFTLAQDRLAGGAADFSTALDTLGSTLLTEIGGAMGPLYGTLFQEMALACRGKPEIDSHTFRQMLERALREVQDLGGAKVGDKTLLDTLVPATTAFSKAVDDKASFAQALQQMTMAAEQGKESTRNLVARIGRASHLGERSRGHLDTGATSCCIILTSMAEAMIRLMK
jgi:dihydroxyacetone kinase-like protein